MKLMGKGSDFYYYLLCAIVSKPKLSFKTGFYGPFV